MITHLVYGIRDGKQLSIHQIKDSERGLACKCYCAECDEPLVAKKGKIRVHHFAHESGKNCPGAIESALHLAAKEIIEKHKRFVIPPLGVMDDRVGDGYVLLHDQISLQLDEVKLEMWLDGFRPDLIVRVGDKELLIEVAVTHFVDEIKVEKIKRRGVSAVEVDLKNLDNSFTVKELELAVISEVTNKRWIFNARQEELLIPYIEREKKYQKELEENRKEALWLKNEKKENLDRKKRRAKILDYNKLKNDNMGEIVCPKKIVKYAHKVKGNKIFDIIKLGRVWNGRVYGEGYGERSIFLNKRPIQILQDKSVDKFDPNRMRTYRLLKKVGRDSTINTDHCEGCKFFKGFADENGYSIYCSFWKKYRELVKQRKK